MQLLRKTVRWAITSTFCCLPLVAAAQEGMVPRNYVLQWSDDFHGTVLDASKWNYRVDVKDFTANTPANISLDGSGHMNIAMRHEDYAGKHFTGGGIASKDTFRYGFYQVQAKITANPGWHTAFWMYAGDGRTIPPRFPPVSNASTEIDDFEIETPSIISMGTLEWLHGQNMASTRCDKNYVPGVDLTAAYHTYGLEWTEPEIKYYFDGKLICTQQYPPSGTPHDRLNIWMTSIAHRTGYTVTDASTPADIGLSADKPSPSSFGKVSYYIRDYYIRNQESGYAEYGSGWTDSLLPGYSRLGTRFNCDSKAFAVWTPTILVAEKYDIQVYLTPSQRGDPAGKILIHAGPKDTTKSVNYQKGNEGWIDLGMYDLSIGAVNSITLSSSGHGCLNPDTVKVLRQ